MLPIAQQNRPLVLREKGNVYAIIEPGDTLSGIAQAEVNDSSAWINIDFEGDPNSLNVGEKVNLNGIYNDKYPKINVVVKHLKPKGTIRGIYYETNLYDPFRLDELHNYYIINGTLVITSPEDVEIAKKIENDFMSEFFQLALGTKADIKQVSSVAKSLKMTPNQEAMFKQEIEYLKKSVEKKNNMNFSYKELIEIGKEIIDMFK